ncbi:MAG: hypothetical protein HY261_07070 [Chloroflexi bacterium]|nr:hypothetical protein [Chloroflexota bacterium]
MATQRKMLKQPKRNPQARLHLLVDELPKRNVLAAERYLEYLADPFLQKMANAPYDDAPLTAADKKAIRQGIADIKAGRVKPWEQVKRELGL